VILQADTHHPRTDRKTQGSKIANVSYTSLAERDSVATGYFVHGNIVEKADGMSWIDAVIDDLAQRPCCGYHQDDSPASEATALTGMALAAYGRAAAARMSADFLAEIQDTDGSVGIRGEQKTPRWPTGLAVLAWLAAGGESDMSANRYGSAIARGVEWILEFRGRTSEKNDLVAHDTTLAAWPWVEGTHSWMEPTSMQLLALKATLHGDDPRAREAVTLLLDRQLVTGGWNYGNTAVLGNLLRPHVQPTGMALLALAGESAEMNRLAKSLEYLRSQLSASTTVSSLAWGLQGLAAHHGMPKRAQDWLEAAYKRPGRIGPSGYRSALIALASLGEASPLVCLSRREPGR